MAKVGLTVASEPLVHDRILQCVARGRIVELAGDRDAVHLRGADSVHDPARCWAAVHSDRGAADELGQLLVES